MTPDHPPTTQLALFGTALPRPDRASDEETAPVAKAGHGFPDGALEPGETLSPTGFAGAEGWRLVTVEGYAYRVRRCGWSGSDDLWEAGHEEDTYWWNGDLEDRALSALLGRIRCDAQTRARFADVWVRYGDRTGEVDWSADEKRTEVEAGVMLVSRFGVAGLLVEARWGWDHARGGDMDGSTPETWQRRQVDHALYTRSWCAWSSGLTSLSSRPFEVLAVVTEAEDEKPTCATSAPFVGKCSRKRSGEFFRVAVSGPNGERGEIVTCGRCLAGWMLDGERRHGRTALDVVGRLAGGDPSPKLCKLNWQQWCDRASELAGQMLADALSAGQVAPWPSADMVEQLLAEACEMGDERAKRAARARVREEQPGAGKKVQDAAAAAAVEERADRAALVAGAFALDAAGYAEICARTDAGTAVAAAEAGEWSKAEEAAGQASEHAVEALAAAEAADHAGVFVAEARERADRANEHARAACEAIVTAREAADAGPVTTLQVPAGSGAADSDEAEAAPKYPRTVDGWEVRAGGFDVNERPQEYGGKLRPEVVPGAWVIQDFHEQQTARRVVDLFKNGNWMVRAVAHEGTERESWLCESIDRVRVVTDAELSDAKRSAFRLQWGQWRGRTYKGIATQHRGKYAVCCACEDCMGLEIYRGGRRIGWCTTLDAALALWVWHITGEEGPAPAADAPLPEFIPGSVVPLDRVPVASWEGLQAAARAGDETPIAANTVATGVIEWGGKCDLCGKMYGFLITGEHDGTPWQADRWCLGRYTDAHDVARRLTGGEQDAEDLALAVGGYSGISDAVEAAAEVRRAQAGYERAQRLSYCAWWCAAVPEVEVGPEGAGCGESTYRLGEADGYAIDVTTAYGYRYRVDRDERRKSPFVVRVLNGREPGAKVGGAAHARAAWALIRMHAEAELLAEFPAVAAAGVEDQDQGGEQPAEEELPQYGSGAARLRAVLAAQPEPGRMAVLRQEHHVADWRPLSTGRAGTERQEGEADEAAAVVRPLGCAHREAGRG
ncbi:hypothetical protein ACFW2K_22670 [Streptomyces nigra]|uniref:hypothetical protein n=1 Tax=Streptomyces nigra TaxID=1827580 RepID=UPI0036C6A841